MPEDAAPAGAQIPMAHLTAPLLRRDTRRLCTPDPTRSSRTYRVAALAAVLGVASTGCAASASPLVLGSIDKAGRPGAEGAIDLALGLADGPHMSIAAGAGRLGGFDSSHVLLAPSIGVSTVKGGFIDQSDRSFSNAAIGLAMPIRLFPDGVESTSLGVGMQGQFTVRVLDLEADRSQLEVGPRLGLELVDGLGAEGGLGGLVSAGVVVRAVAFDRSFRMF